MVSTCSINFLSSWTAGLEADDDEAAPTLGIAAVNSACKIHNKCDTFLNGYSYHKLALKQLEISAKHFLAFKIDALP